MKYCECPDNYLGNEKSLFLAGGISGCDNWQLGLLKLLENEDLVIINPRRKDFQINNPNMEQEQITWEYNYLKKASGISFWFPNETLCPITLFELGKVSQYNKPLFIGVDPKYARRRDIEIQMALTRPEIKIVYSLDDLAEQIKIWSRN